MIGAPLTWREYRVSSHHPRRRLSLPVFLTTSAHQHKHDRHHQEHGHHRQSPEDEGVAEERKLLRSIEVFSHP